MLSRVLEPEAMDSPEEARDYDAMDHSTVNRVFVADFLTCWQEDGPILDLGTGTAQIPIELCRQNATARVVAIDLAENMLAVARQNICQAGLKDRIRLQRCDAKHLPFSAGAFEAVISNSIVHHIPDPARVLAEMIRAARSGGLLFVRDLLRPADEETVHRLVGQYAGSANSHQQQMFAASLRAALTLSEIRELVAGLDHDPTEATQTSDRHWTWTTCKG